MNRSSRLRTINPYPDACRSSKVISAKKLFEHLQEPPTERGYEKQAWSTKLLLHHVKEKYGVEYSKGHRRKLMGKAGLSCRTARPRNHEADPEEEAEFQQTA
ncbi:winged helix-turn-helix domain-containing protein [Natronomonas aquatica]|uniref:winged helix-turn-helix domain-containing protein n=1 Tax=Natronomonas aquatica TaxID=2841590 RepID=UPI00210E16D4|nr:winged helix-turn-helix domain-containing protein [Natronomonas aquatica]